jgi:processive 1,2-diacylglycerol beta-glucosyltransferase
MPTFPTGRGSLATATLPGERHDVLILSARYGEGHWQAAAAVREALGRFGNPLMLDYIELANPALNRTARRVYIASIKHFPRGYGWFYRKTSALPPYSRFNHLVNGLGRQRLLDLIAQVRPSVVVSTFPVQAGVLSELRQAGRADVAAVTVITDNTVHSQWVHPHTDLYCVSSEEVAGLLSAQGVPPERVAVTGIPLRAAFARRVDAAEVRRRYRFDPSLPIVLVMSGAFGALGGVVDACRVLTHLGLPLQVVVVAGKDKQLLARLQRMKGHLPYPVHTFGYVEQIADFMSAASILVTKAGGVTTAEALALGLPMVIYRAIPGQEEANAAYLCRHGAAVSARQQEDLAAACRELLGNPERLAAMAAAAGRMGRPRASAEIASMVLRLAAEPPRGRRAPAGTNS